MSQLLNQIDYGIWRSVGSVNCTFKFNLMHVYNHNFSSLLKIYWEMFSIVIGQTFW